MADDSSDSGAQVPAPQYVSVPHPTFADEVADLLKLDPNWRYGSAWPIRAQDNPQSASGLTLDLALPTSVRDQLVNLAKLAQRTQQPNAGVEPGQTLPAEEVGSLLGLGVGAGLGRVPENSFGAFGAYHGSPHSFEKFSDDAIGTGEGAQTYGYGHYVAGNKTVANQYYNRLSDWIYNDPEATPQQLRGFSKLNEIAQSQRVDPVNKLSQLIDNYQNTYNAASKTGNWQYTVGGKEGLEQAISDFKSIDPNKISKSGALYDIHVKPDENQLLDHDTPLGQQSLAVQSGVEKAYKNAGIDFPSNWDRLNGEEHYDNLANADYTYSGRHNEMLASKALSDAGVPGIKYLDQFSRDEREPEPMFDKKPIPGPNWLNNPEKTIMDFSPQELATDKFWLKFHYDDPNMEEALDQALQDLQSREFNASEQRKNGFASLHPDTEKTYRAASDWLMQNRDRFSFEAQPKTRNYVIFDPSDLTITHRNGVQLQPVPHDPFQFTPVDHDPFAGSK